MSLRILLFRIDTKPIFVILSFVCLFPGNGKVHSGDAKAGRGIDENILLIDGLMVVKAMIGILLACWI